mgnify:CR=1 FL=1
MTKMKIWLIPLKDKRGEELCTHMYNPLQRFISRVKVRRSIRRLGYQIRKTSKEEQIFDRDKNLVGKLKTVNYNRHNIEPTVFLSKNYLMPWLKEAITKSGCSWDYLN